MNSNLQTSLYRTWKSMRYRCDNPRNPMFHNYGALGISYCPDWTSFHSFISIHALARRATATYSTRVFYT